MTKVAFNYTMGTKREVVIAESIIETGFYNLKNKAAGARNYSFGIRVVQYTNLEGQVAFEGVLQAYLSGARYQSSKDARWYATAEDARTAVCVMMAGSLKRYAKLAQDPANKIEARF